jgi:LysR family nod box-dependent transcriptional activator
VALVPRKSNWDLNLLIPLEVLLTECSVTRAAERLYLTQPAMSKVLARLRRHFDDPLLVRNGRNLGRTALGDHLLDRVHELLAQINQLAPRTFDPATAKRSFALMMSDFATAVLMPSILHTLTSCPGVSLHVRAFGASYATDLEDGTIDLLLTSDEHLLAQHRVASLFTEKWVVITAADNPLVGERLSVAQYTAMRHVVVRYEDGRVPAMEEAYIRKHGIERQVVAYVPSYAQLMWLLRGTTYLGIVQERIARTAQQALGLRVLPPPMDLPPLREVMQWHRRSDSDNGVAWLRSVIHDAAAGAFPDGDARSAHVLPGMHGMPNEPLPTDPAPS